MGKLAEAYVEISAHDQTTPALGKARSNLESFADNAKSMLAAFAASGVTAAVGHFMADAVTKAADLGETMSKVEQVFGSSAPIVTDMAQNLADSFGSVKITTLDAAANLGMIAQGSGLSAEASARLSTQLVRLADDASSFYNVPLDVALEKIRSGLVGESEPLRQFGVLLSETAVKAKAQEMGLGGAKRELTESEKVLARVQIITESLNKVQGDHARTIESYTNQIRRFNGEWENFKTDIGTQILPTATDFLKGSRVTLEGVKKQGGAALSDRLLVGMFGGESGFKIREGSLMDSLIGDQVRAARAREQARADKLAGVVTGLDSRDPNAKGAPRGFNELEFWANRQRQFLDQQEAKRRADFEAKKFNGFAPFGMMGALMGNDPLWMLRSGLMEKMTEAGVGKLPVEWAGAHITSGMDFARQAQEKILSKDDVPSKQLDELKKIREAIEKADQKPKMASGPVVLRGRES